mmetsp:Transcript_25893/g.42309  ORF Transcript_25893/g.42309 Transcript_25893/m.42309 type:complete len:261 (+) Transcript_25893:410-1192(+)
MRCWCRFVDKTRATLANSRMMRQVQNAKWAIKVAVVNRRRLRKAMLMRTKRRRNRMATTLRMARMDNAQQQPMPSEVRTHHCRPINKAITLRRRATTTLRIRRTMAAVVVKEAITDNSKAMAEDINVNAAMSDTTGNSSKAMDISKAIRDRDRRSIIIRVDRNRNTTTKAAISNSNIMGNNVVRSNTTTAKATIAAINNNKATIAVISNSDNNRNVVVVMVMVVLVLARIWTIVDCAVMRLTSRTNKTLILVRRRVSLIT